MDKIVLDTFEPKTACFEAPPADPSKDGCTIDVTFHSTDAPNSPQPSLQFQREKDTYAFAPGSGAISVVKAASFNEKSSTVQSALHFSVFLNGVLRSQYPNFKSAKNYSGPDLMPLSVKATNFIAAGDIESPDATQRKNTSALLRDLWMVSNESKTWFTGTFNSLNDPQVNQKFVPLPMRPRVEWLSDQLATFQKLNAGITPLSEATPETKALRNDLILLNVDVLDYLATGEGSLTKLRTSMDSAARRLWPQQGSGEVRDIFAYYRKKLEPMFTDSFYKNNSEAKKRIGMLHAVVKNAELEHRAELLGSDEATAFKKGIEYRLKEAAAKGHLASRVKTEMDDANLSTMWLQSNIDEISKAIVPYFSLEKKEGQPTRVTVDAKGLVASVNKLVSDHMIQEREYMIGAVAALRYLLGTNFTDSKMEAWVGGQYSEVEVGTNELSNRNLSDLHDSLSRKIRKSVKQTSGVLPWVEGGIGVLGAGALTAGFIIGKDKSPGYPLIVGGASGLGAGGGALLCHAVWKSRNQYLTDSICGIVGGVGLGLAAGFAFKPESHGPMIPPNNNPPIDGRNPVTGNGP